jgi:hypothetical protein
VNPTRASQPRPTFTACWLHGSGCLKGAEWPVPGLLYLVPLAVFIALALLFIGATSDAVPGTSHHRMG